MTERRALHSLVAALMVAGVTSCTNDYDRFVVGEGGGVPSGTGAGTTVGAGASGQGGTATQSASQVGSGGSGGLGPGGAGGGPGQGGSGQGGSIGAGGAGGGTLEALILETHPAGQATDKFVLTPALPDAELFAFGLSPTGSIDVAQIVIDLSGVQGVTTADVSNGRLYRDLGTIGALDPADLQVGSVGVASVAGATGTVTFTLPSPLTLTGPQPMLFVADVASLGMTDAMSVTLAALSISASGTASQMVVTPSGAVSGATHQVIAADLAAGDALLYYGQAAVATPLVRAYDDSASTWSPPIAAASAGATLRWVVTPDAFAADEYVAVLSDDGSATKLDILHRATTTWAVEWTTTGINTSDSRRRGFDIEREASSGDALVVYSNDTATPQFRTRSGGLWSSEAPIVLSAAAGTVKWMELVARPGTNEITLLFTDASDDLSAVIWDGDSWSTRTVLETTVNTINHLGFAGAYESLSGDFVAVWGVVDPNPLGFHWARRPAGAAAFSPDVGPEAAPLLRPGVVRMASEPGTDRIAIAYLELTCGGTGCDDFITAIWDGTTNAWTFKTRADADIGANYTNQTGSVPVEVAWLGTSGTAVAVYGDSGSNLDWARFTTATGWVLQTDFTPTPTLAQRVNFQALSRPGKAEVMWLVADTNGDLFAKSYDGTAWSNLGGALETSVSTPSTGAFAALMKP